MRIKLPFTDLQPPMELTRNEERGWILEGDKRILSFRVKTFQALVNRLTSMAGSMVSATLLFQMGREIGETAFKYSKDSAMADVLVKVFDSVLIDRGWGRCLKVERGKDTETTYVFTIAECPLCYELKQTEPICHLMGGLVTGWIEAFQGIKARQTLETACAAVGDKFCVFEVSFHWQYAVSLDTLG